jgi:hypothetical protein
MRAIESWSKKNLLRKDKKEVGRREDGGRGKGY